MTVWFDDSLPIATSIIRTELGDDLLGHTVFVRDTTGRLSAVVGASLDTETLERVGARLHEELGPYARDDRALTDQNGFGAARLLVEAQGALQVYVGDHKVKLLERRIVGADWLRPPSKTAGPVPRIVFSSLKGGVGRSTALCVMAAYLSRRGLRVLCVDFDLEAPGIGSMLLRTNELPKFGMLDYFVESGISTINPSFLNDLIGDSYLGSAGARVAVIPAIGAATESHPENAIAKLSRAYLEEFSDDGKAISLTERLRRLIEQLEATSSFDVVLLDARAGLHESTAAAIQGLGADTLLFGTDQPQTYLGYSLLMKHLAQFPADGSDDWRERIRFVHAKASDSESTQARALERFADLYKMLETAPADLEPEGDTLTSDDFAFEWETDDPTVARDIEDEFAIPQVLRILDDSNYRDFDPIARAMLLEHASYRATFESLLDYGDEIANSILNSITT
ncbi:hypothetical protein DF049_26245 [Burkholderia cenocepacia]|uniref:KGGVGR-motif variant AAA ATPase n=1 Tax=Burkholderia cenocepacia TaxID=95486 RepID=UPI000F5769AF|nr:AAA family ATPase [Burkholderia cenocepacia]RQU73078.1 hypothetical protein DF049_26245 [Burkholderia cenocepacia]HDR9124371.1 AAA family ATPase [Burkholderia vietnamiensis]